MRLKNTHLVTLEVRAEIHQALLSVFLLAEFFIGKLTVIVLFKLGESRPWVTKIDLHNFRGQTTIKNRVSTIIC